MPQPSYRQTGEAFRTDQQQRKTLLQGIENHIRTQGRNGHVYPITIQFRTGPWLYAKENEDSHTRTEPLEKEIGILMERLYRYGTRNRERSRETGWSFLGWPDTGGERGFLHYHGFCHVHAGKWSESGLSFEAWIETLGETLRQESIQSVHVSAPLVSDDCVKTFNSYASRRNIGAPCWYKAGQRLPVLKWEKRTTKSGWTIWTSDQRGYVITQKSGKADDQFRVWVHETAVYSAAKLKDAMGWCEADFANKNKGL